ncbi:MFS transporter [Paenibacillus chartarius]|uniref:MFS transporter n=1 Tax=Paenibacillus chartarius TaxID=747481 RepID=A0ABV6DI26_9BACL
MNNKSYPWHLLLVTSLGVLLVTLNLSTLNVALPELSAYFNAGPIASNWILLSYMLFNSILILVFGKWADIYGRRRLYLIGLAGFTAVSFLCGFAPNVWVLIVLRILQAAGGAIIITNTTPMITDAFPERSLGTALGINVLVSSAAQLLGPVIGGYFVYILDWRWVFWFNVPIGIIGLVWASIVLRPVPGKARGEKMDMYGNLFIFLSVGGLIFSFSQGSIIGWGSLPVVAGLVMFVVFLVCFIWWERRVSYPTVDFGMFRDRAYAMANLATFLNALARSSVVLLVALYFQVVHKENTFVAGLHVLPVTAGMILASPIVGALSSRYSTLALSTSGLLMASIGMLLLSVHTGVEASYWWIAAGQFLVGFGSGMFMTPNTKSIMLTVPPEKRGVANGLRSMLQNIGVVISTAMSLMLVTSVLPADLKDSIYAGANAEVSGDDIQLISGGFRLAFLTLMVLTFISIAVSYMRNNKSTGKEKNVTASTTV